MRDDDCVLDVKDLAVQFTLPRQGLFAEPARVRAVDGVSFSVRRGRTFGIVGESGSGKTTTALSVMRLAPTTSGSVILNGKNIESVGGEELRLLRRRMQIVFQDPFSSLNPRMRAGDIVREPMDLLEVGDVSTREERVSELFAAVGLRADQRNLYPHQFSGGQRQRICIARALATKPDLIVCDEPVSALDVAVQAQILNLLKRLQESHNFTYLFISHDLGVVQYICHDVAVMYLGRLVEQSSSAELFAKPLHPYTWALMSAVPSARPSDQGKARVRLTGDPPSPINPPAGCGFSPRCPFATEQCWAERPQLRKFNGGRLVACHLVDASGDGPHHRLEAV